MTFSYPQLFAITRATPAGLYKISHEAYHDGIGLSSSDLKNALVSYGYYSYKKDADDEPTPSMEFGRAFHMAVLEPELFRETYVVMPEFTGLTKDGRESTQSAEAKAKRQAWLDDNRSKEIITAENQDQILTLAAAVRAHPRWRDVGNLSAEVAAIVPDAAHAVLKCKPDLLGSAIIDVKTTVCAAPWEFNKAVTRFGYHISAAFYQDVVQRVTGEVLPFVFLAVEKKPPFGVAFYTLSDEYLREGRLLYQAALRRIETWAAMPPERRALHYGSSIQVLTPTTGTLYKTKDLLDGIARDT